MAQLGSSKVFGDLVVTGTTKTPSIEINGVAVTSTAAELNILDGATLTTTELNYVDGVTSAIQTQLDAKAPSTHVGATGSAHGVATTSVNGFMSSTDKTKLDGIAANANNYTHPTYTYTTPTAGTETTLTDITLLESLSQTNGHVTGASYRKLVAGSGVNIVPSSDGNITIEATTGGGGTVTSITAGEGLVSTSNPITTSGTISVDAAYIAAMAIALG